MPIRKQTSSRISSAAARLLAKLPKRGGAVVYADGDRAPLFAVRTRVIRSICASLISQDETKGQSKPKRKRRKGLR